MELVLLMVTAGVVGWVLWRATEGVRGRRWTRAPEPVDVELRHIPATPDEPTHPVIAAVLLVLSILIVALGIAAGVYLAGRFVVERLAQLLGV